jgi:hypothetical protein
LKLNSPIGFELPRSKEAKGDRLLLKVFFAIFQASETIQTTPHYACFASSILGRGKSLFFG